MTPVDIIRMAQEAGMAKAVVDAPMSLVLLERFATLVAAAESDKWAVFCESNQVSCSPRGGRHFMPFHSGNGGIHEGMDYAAAIRARSKQPGASS